MRIRLITTYLFCIAAGYMHAQCFDMSTLTGEGVVCRYGTFDNPDANQGIDNQKGEYTHLVMSEVGQRDPIVNQLQTIPAGESHAVRLGNSSVNSMAESITYDFIPTAENPILLLKYAAVMQNPEHSYSEQPRLTMNVSDINGVLIEPECMSFDFVSSPSLGWNTEDNGSLLWKDWTYIGVDMTPYIGRKLKVKLTNYDCSQGAHFGYVYIHLSCQQKKIRSKACGGASSTAFSAPTGFTYSWYKIQNGTATAMGTAQTITVPIDGGEYRCDLHQIGKPECSFSLNVFAERRYPIADFTIRKVEGCADTLYITNTSGVSADGVSKNYPLELCDEVVWDLGDGRLLDTYQLSSIPIVYEHGGKYTIQLTAKLVDGGCANVAKQVVNVVGAQDPHDASVTASICDGSFYSFGGKKLTEAGLYTHTSITARGCDSVTTLNLLIKPSYLIEETQSFCNGDSIIWRGQKIKRAGTFYDRLISSQNCDSIYKLTTSTWQTYYVKDTAYYCIGDSVYLHGRFIKQQGTYIDTLFSRNGCDSIVQTFVGEKPYFYFKHEATICGNETYEYRGTTYNVEGVYTDVLTSAYGCDSIYELTLHVNPTYLMPTYVEVCHDQTFMFRGRELDAPGIYYDTLLTRTGCDSIYKLVFNKTPIYLFEDTVTICEGSSYNFRGRDVSEEGFYYDSLQSINGCDSVYKLLLKVEPLAMQLIDTILCGGVYDFRGRALTQSGIYHDTVRTAFGCDSIFELNLTINPTYLLSQYVEQCEGDAFLFRGRLVDQPGVYYDSLFTHDGCDSVYQLVYNIAPTYLQEFEDSICSNKTYLFRGMEITRPGIYIDTLQTISGCDSLFKLTLHHLPSYSFVSLDTAEGCSGEVFFNGREIKHSGIYTDSLQTTCGCDSIYTANVIINEAYLFEESQKICDHAPYIFRGRRITQSGIYEDSLTTVAGCDSIYRLIAEVTHTLRDTIVDTVCVGEAYIFYSLLLQKEGFYSDTLSDPMGRRCEIHSIELGAKAPSMITQVSVGLSCANAMEYELQFHYYGAKPYTYSIIYDEAALSNGFVNVIDAPYRDTIYAPIPQYKDSDYLRPDYYHARLELQNGICDPQKTGYNYDLLIRYPSWIIRQHWNDVVAVLNSSYNGGYLFDKYEWEVNGRMLETTDSNYSNLYMPELRFGDNVCAYLTRKGETYSIPTCPIEIIDNTQAIIGDNPIIVYPTTVNKAHPVLNVRASNDATYAIYNSYGHFISSGHLNQNDNIQVMLPVCSGVYLFVTNDASAIYTTKILVQ